MRFVAEQREKILRNLWLLHRKNIDSQGLWVTTANSTHTKSHNKIPIHINFFDTKINACTG